MQQIMQQIMLDKVIKLVSGKGNGYNTACLMTASNMLIGEGSAGDEATCQCTLLRAFILKTNDQMPDAMRTKYYGPLVYEILGTRNEDIDILQQRAYAFADWAVREIAPIALEANRHMRKAEELRKLEPIVNKQTAAAAHDTIDAADATHGYATRAHGYAAAAAAAANIGYVHAAAEAAAYAAVAAAAAARCCCRRGSLADGREQIWAKCAEIILRVAAIGDRRPVETVMTLDELSKQLSSQLS